MSALQRGADDGAPATTQRRKAGSHLLPNATGGVRLGSTLLSGLAAGVYEPRVLRCVLCQVQVVIISYAHFHLSRPNCYKFALSLLLNSEQCLNSILQATFRSVAEEQQHLAGPAHRKALLRQQTEQEHKSRLAKGRDAAHSAVVSMSHEAYVVPNCAAYVQLCTAHYACPLLASLLEDVTQPEHKDHA